MDFLGYFGYNSYVLKGKLNLGDAQALTEIILYSDASRSADLLNIRKKTNATNEMADAYVAEPAYAVAFA